jgi:hypothetical protein
MRTGLTFFCDIAYSGLQTVLRLRKGVADFHDMSKSASAVSSRRRSKLSPAAYLRFRMRSAKPDPLEHFALRRADARHQSDHSQRSVARGIGRKVTFSTWGAAPVCYGGQR